MQQEQQDPRAIGDLKGFPTEIIEAMLDEQERQGNPRDVTVFQRDRGTDSNAKGFFWDSTKERGLFWVSTLIYKDFDLFFERHPKQN